MKHLISFVLAIFMLLSMLPAGFADLEGEPQACVDLYLESNPSTGYLWAAESSDESVAYVQSSEAAAEDSDSGLVGQPFVAPFRICGSGEGTAEITFSYARPWEDAAPAMQFTVSVSVDAQLNVTASNEIVLPCSKESGWSFGTETAILEIEDNGYTEDVGQSFTLKPLADGFDTVTFTQYGLDGLLPGAFLYTIQTKADQVCIYSIDFVREVPVPDVPFAPEFLFDTTDLDGNSVTEQIFAGHSLTILNFWEPWCGPCVREMPFLQQVSQEYADKGVQIIGIYSTPDSEDDVAAVLEETGVTYPILHYVPEFDFLQTGYVPTTVFVNGSGIIVKQPFSTALNYASWVALIEELL